MLWNRPRAGFLLGVKYWVLVLVGYRSNRYPDFPKEMELP